MGVSGSSITFTTLGRLKWDIKSQQELRFKKLNIHNCMLNYQIIMIQQAQLFLSSLSLPEIMISFFVIPAASLFLSKVCPISLTSVVMASFTFIPVLELTSTYCKLCFDARASPASVYTTLSPSKSDLVPIIILLTSLAALVSIWLIHL